MKVGIIGNGWVGKAMHDLFPDAPVYIRDTNKSIKEGKLLEGVNYTEFKEIINECDIAFICVPTPNLKVGDGSRDSSYTSIYDKYGEGRLNTSIVEECIEWCNAKLLVVRSTVNPGDCDRWEKKYNKIICMQPEYLGETPAHPLLNTKQTNFLIIGGELAARRKVIQLYQEVYNANITIRQVTNLEAEIIKLTENRAIGFKVAQAQELYDVCQKAKVDYYTIREAVYGDDPRFNMFWTFIYPEKRGFNSKCIPKDIYAWCAWAESLGYEPRITRAILEKNKEWINNG